MKQLFLAMVFLPSALFALDLTVMGGLGNFSFDPSREKPIGAGEMNGTFYPLGRISVSGRISDVFGFSTALQREPLLRTTLTGEMSIRAGYFSVQAGPLIGLFNSPQVPFKPGASAGIGLEFPGIFFVQILGGGTFGTIKHKGDYEMEMGRIALGFWLPNLVNTFSINGKRYTAIETDTLAAEDELLRFCYRMNIYAKNVPYTVSIDMGYQSLQRSYYENSGSGKDTIRSVFLGFETNITIRPRFVLRAGAELPVFVWGKDPLTKAKSTWFFQAFAGFTWTFEEAGN